MQSQSLHLRKIGRKSQALALKRYISQFCVLVTYKFNNIICLLLEMINQHFLWFQTRAIILHWDTLNNSIGGIGGTISDSTRVLWQPWIILTITLKAVRYKITKARMTSFNCCVVRPLTVVLYYWISRAATLILFGYNNNVYLKSRKNDADIFKEPLVHNYCH